LVKIAVSMASKRQSSSSVVQPVLSDCHSLVTTTAVDFGSLSTSKFVSSMVVVSAMRSSTWDSAHGVMWGVLFHIQDKCLNHTKNAHTGARTFWVFIFLEWVMWSKFARMEFPIIPRAALIYPSYRRPISRGNRDKRNTFRWLCRALWKCFAIRGIVQLSLGLLSVFAFTNPRDVFIVPPHLIPLLLIRGIFGASSYSISYKPLSLAPIGIVTSIFFVNPIFTAIASSFVLKERISFKTRVEQICLLHSSWMMKMLFDLQSLKGERRFCSTWNRWKGKDENKA